MPKTQSPSSTEYILVPITSQVLGQPYDPTGDTVAMAFLPSGQDPQDSDAHPAIWETWPGSAPMSGAEPPYPSTFYASCLVGPANGGVVLAPGRYRVWVRVGDNPEVVWVRADWLTIA